MSKLLNPSRKVLQFASRHLSLVSYPWKCYLKFLHTHPVKAQAANTGVIFATGDILVQTFLEKRRCLESYDKWRTLRFLGVGLFIFGPTMCVWYTELARRASAGPKAVAAFRMMLLDQTLFLPGYIASFIGVMAVLRGETRKEVGEKLVRDYWPIQSTGWKFWPAVQLVNFYFVPLHHRILLMNLVSLVFNAYLGWRAEKKTNKEMTP